MWLWDLFLHFEKGVPDDFSYVILCTIVKIKERSTRYIQAAQKYTKVFFMWYVENKQNLMHVTLPFKSGNMVLYNRA